MEFNSSYFVNLKGFRKAYNKMRNDIISYFKIEDLNFHMPNRYVTLYGKYETGYLPIISGSISEFEEWIKNSKCTHFYLNTNIEIKRRVQ